MRILSWNLWWRYGSWEQRREAIAAPLAEVRPDLCGLQEVWGAPGENLAAGLAGEARVAVHARIEAPGGALPVFTTHLTYGAGRSQVRTEQVRRLAAFVADHAADCAYPHFAVVADLQQEAR